MLKLILAGYLAAILGIAAIMAPLIVTMESLARAVEVRK